MLVYDSRFHLFPGKFKSRWFGPCTVKKVLSNGAVEIQSPSQGTFTVNGQRLKQYLAGELLPNNEEQELPASSNRGGGADNQAARFG